MSERLRIGPAVGREDVADAICRANDCEDDTGTKCKDDFCRNYVMRTADAVLKLMEREVETFDLYMANGDAGTSGEIEAGALAVLRAAGLKVKKVKEDERRNDVDHQAGRVRV